MKIGKTTLLTGLVIASTSLGTAGSAFVRAISANTATPITTNSSTTDSSTGNSANSSTQSTDENFNPMKLHLMKRMIA
jgi:hypothetical protein